MNDNLTLKVFTVDRHIEVDGCDYVKLSISDSCDGRFSGSYGIKRGHARAVFSLCEGTVTASKGTQILFKAETSEGFATVEDDIVSVTVDKVKEK